MLSPFFRFLPLRLKKLSYILFHPFAFPYLFRGVSPSAEHLRILSFISPSQIDIFFDVGSNNGQFLLLLRSVPSTSRHPVVCFEPLHSAFSLLKRLFFFQENTTMYNIALGASPSKAILNVPSSPDSSSLLPVSSLQSQFYGVRSTKRYQEVQVDTLDSYLYVHSAENAFLKLDVQGYELEVLRGCTDLRRHFRYIYLEASFVSLYEGQPLASEIIAHLYSSGYSLVAFENADRFYNSPKLAQSDLLFERQ